MYKRFAMCGCVTCMSAWYCSWSERETLVPLGWSQSVGGKLLFSKYGLVACLLLPGSRIQAMLGNVVENTCNWDEADGSFCYGRFCRYFTSSCFFTPKQNARFGCGKWTLNFVCIAAAFLPSSVGNGIGTPAGWLFPRQSLSVFVSLQVLSDIFRSAASHSPVLFSS